VVAAVVLEVGASASEQALREHVAAELARYKVPDVVRIVGEFPRNAMGKVVKRELLAQFGD
jgi:long-chain acyl-CoA synthetase